MQHQSSVSVCKSVARSGDADRQGQCDQLIMHPRSSGDCKFSSELSAQSCMHIGVSLFLSLPIDFVSARFLLLPSAVIFSRSSLWLDFPSPHIVPPLLSCIPFFCPLPPLQSSSSVSYLPKFPTAPRMRGGRRTYVLIFLAQKKLEANETK